MIQRTKKEMEMKRSFAACLYRQGYTCRQIGDRMGVSIAYVQQMVDIHKRKVWRNLKIGMMGAHWDLDIYWRDV